jgi:hypothetical protein
MSLFDEINELEKIANQVSCLGNVLELVAAKIIDSAESGTLWLCHDVCENLADRIDRRIVELLKIHNNEQNEHCFEAEFVRNARIKDEAGEE